MLKKVFKMLIISFVLLVILFCVYFLILQKPKVAVLTYHDIVENVYNPHTVNISVEKFEKQIKWLHDNNYKALTIDEYYEWKKNNKKIPRKSVLITFDDGWHSFYTKAVPILEKYNMKASVFVIWKYSENCQNSGDKIYMNFDEIKDIIDNHKTMNILSHSYDLHEEEKAKSNNKEIYSDDMKIVRSLTEQEIKYYAYPFGKANNEYISALKENNYKLAFTFGPYAFSTKDDNDYLIPRIGLFESTKDWKFKIKMFLKL